MPFGFVEAMHAESGVPRHDLHASEASNKRLPVNQPVLERCPLLYCALVCCCFSWYRRWIKQWVPVRPSAAVVDEQVAIIWHKMQRPPSARYRPNAPTSPPHAVAVVRVWVTAILSPHPVKPLQIMHQRVILVLVLTDGMVICRFRWTKHVQRLKAQSMLSCTIFPTTPATVCQVSLSICRSCLLQVACGSIEDRCDPLSYVEGKNRLASTTTPWGAAQRRVNQGPVTHSHVSSLKKAHPSPAPPPAVLQSQQPPPR